MQTQAANVTPTNNAHLAALGEGRKKNKHAKTEAAQDDAPLVMAKEPEGDIIWHPHSQCVVSILNKRTIPHTDEEIERLAALILPRGVVQNLIGFRQKKKGVETGVLEIVAGGGRFKGVALLIARGQARTEYPLPVKVVSEEDAIAYSVAENMGRKAMHLAEIIDAMRQMIDDQGKHPLEVGAAFGFSTRETNRLLALSAISPRLFGMFRNNEIKYEQAIQFTLTDDHKLQEQVWDSVPDYNRRPEYLRRLILNQKVSASKDPVARYVGVKAYEKAGGVVMRDLFSENDEGFLSDPALLEQLAVAKLDKRAEPFRAEGWKWVEIVPRADYQYLHSFTTAPKMRRTLTDDEQTTWDGLVEEYNKFQTEIEACEDEDKANELCDKQGDVEAKMNEFEELLMEIPPTVRALSGVVIYLDDKGQPKSSVGLIRDEDLKAAKAAAKAIDGNGVGGDLKAATPSKKEAPREHSDRLTRQLTAHRTAGMQAMVAAQPNVALVVLTHRLAKSVFSSELLSQESTLKLHAEHVDLKRDTPDMEQSRAWKEMEEKRADWKSRIKSRGKKKSLFAWLLEMPLEDLLNLMAFCTAASVSAIHTREQRDKTADELAAALGFDMADWWTPTADNYFAQVPKARAVEIVTEAVSKEAAAPLQTMKKGEAAATAERALQDKRWTPKFLRLKQ